ncbi:arad-like aldolase/epimerase [Thozetella sp. PMI_491]|nr:arad-like aldolase/epimerase [Thozetella sp. PMI_491]
MKPSTAARPEAQEVQSMGKAKDGRELKILAYPKFDSLVEERLYRKQHFAAALRVFADREFDEDITGHMSVRDPVLIDHFCGPAINELPGLNPLSMHFSLNKVLDLILVDENGLVVKGDQPTACHPHSVYGKAFDAFGRELEMLTQDSLRFYKDFGIYNNISEVVLDQEEADSITVSLGHRKALLADSAVAGGYKKILIDEEEAEYSRKNLGGSDKGWLTFQPCYEEQLAKTGGKFLA